MSYIKPDALKEVIEGYFNGTNFYTDALFTDLITPESGKIYVDLSTNLQYRWGGSAYVLIGGGVYSPIIDTDFPILTGTTAITTIKGIVIPANTIPDNCVLRIKFFVNFTKSSNYKTFYCNLNSTIPDLNIIVGYISAITNNNSFDYMVVKRDLLIKNGQINVTKYSNSTTDARVGLINQININLATANTFYISGKLDDSADSIEVLGATFEIIK